MCSCAYSTKACFLPSPTTLTPCSPLSFPLYLSLSPPSPWPELPQISHKILGSLTGHTINLLVEDMWGHLVPISRSWQCLWSYSRSWGKVWPVVTWEGEPVKSVQLVSRPTTLRLQRRSISDSPWNSVGRLSDKNICCTSMTWDRIPSTLVKSQASHVCP